MPARPNQPLQDFFDSPPVICTPSASTSRKPPAIRSRKSSGP